MRKEQSATVRQAQVGLTGRRMFCTTERYCCSLMKPSKGEKALHAHIGYGDPRYVSVLVKAASSRAKVAALSVDKSLLRKHVCAAMPELGGQAIYVPDGPSFKRLYVG